MSSSSDKSLVRTGILLNDVCGLPHHRHPLSPKTVVERGWRGYSISFLSRYPRPPYDFSRPPVSTDTQEHGERWIHISDRFAVKYDRYGRKKHVPRILSFLHARPPGDNNKEERINACVEVSVPFLIKRRVSVCLFPYRLFLIVFLRVRIPA